LVNALHNRCNGEATLEQLIQEYKSEHYPHHIYRKDYVNEDEELKSNYSKLSKLLIREDIIKREFRVIRNEEKNKIKKIPYYVQVRLRLNEEILKMIDNIPV
jgi:polyribonucleotide nucleotidyltransferase